MISFKNFLLEQEQTKRCNWCGNPGASEETQYFGEKSGVHLCDECRTDMYQTQDKKMMDMLYQSSRANKPNTSMGSY